MLEIKPLTYDFDALKPVIGSDTMFFHHEKHYAGYVTKANDLMPKKWADKPLEEIVVLSREKKDVPLFNQVAQVWNHEFFFKGLSLNPEDREMSDDLSFYINKDFHNVENLKNELVKTALSQFGSSAKAFAELVEASTTSDLMSLTSS